MQNDPKPSHRRIALGSARTNTKGQIVGKTQEPLIGGMYDGA